MEIKVNISWIHTRHGLRGMKRAHARQNRLVPGGCPTVKSATEEAPPTGVDP